MPSCQKVAQLCFAGARMEAMTRHAWLDVSAGVAGDMLLGACAYAGADLAAVEDVVRRIVGPAVSLHHAEVTRAGQ
ncbi:MAG: nickel insertion protein, partial [Actinomycetota bacterium]